MPRGQKSKLRAREKRRKARGETQSLSDAQATAAEKGESPSPSSPVLGNIPLSSPAAGSSQKPRRALPTTTAAAGASCTRSDRGAKSQGQENAGSSEASSSTESSSNDPITREVGMLIYFLLEKYKNKEPIRKAAMLKAVNKKNKEHFPEILKRASHQLELTFGLHLKEVNPSGQSYTVVSLLDLNDDGSLRGDSECPKNGLLMPLLAMIFLEGNCATEEDIWEFLNILGIYDGRRHLIFGDPRKLITQDLVQEKYLVYQQVYNSDPPRYEFLWGPKAHAEISKMKVLEFLAKVNETVPSAFPFHYEEALRDQEERARARAAARPGTSAMASACPRATASSSSHP